MTPIKFKTFKDKDMTRLEAKINEFLKVEKVTEIVHAGSSTPANTIQNAITLFYRVEEVKEKPKPVLQAKPQAKTPVPPPQEPQTSKPKVKEQDNG